ncbi:MAG: hypothetical protein Q4F67_04505 [Propionibacteriaceae bacterium]|nr:hypothetical protein [Propionibacteriaceae bacterium]
MVQWEIPNVADLDDIQLSEVLRNLNRWTMEGRLKAAQSPATKSYLQAGLRLLAKAVMPPAREDVDPQIHPFVAFLSRKKVVNEVAEEEHPDLPRRGSVGGLRDLWDPHRDFLMDLLRASLLIEPWVSAVSGTTLAQLSELDDPLQMVHEVAVANATAVPADAGFRIQLLATIMAAREPELHESLARMYDSLAESWATVYEAVITSWGYKLRAGMTYQTLADILMGLAEGLALRQVGAPDQRILDEQERTSLMETGALAILSACVEPVDGDESFESFVRSRLNGRLVQTPGRAESERPVSP